MPDIWCEVTAFYQALVSTFTFTALLFAESSLLPTLLDFLAAMSLEAYRLFILRNHPPFTSFSMSPSRKE